MTWEDMWDMCDELAAQLIVLTGRLPDIEASKTLARYADFRKLR